MKVIVKKKFVENVVKTIVKKRKRDLNFNKKQIENFQLKNKNY